MIYFRQVSHPYQQVWLLYCILAIKFSCIRNQMDIHLKKQQRDVHTVILLHN